MDKAYAGAESGVGAQYAWSGNRKAGQGNMEITHVEPNSKVEIALEFLKPFKAKNTTVFDLERQDDVTRVNWSMTGEKTFMTKVIGIFKSMDSMVGPDFEEGLSQLKSVAERSTN